MKARTGVKAGQLAAPPTLEDQAGADALIGLGVGLLVWLFAPPDVRARIIKAIRPSKAKPDGADLASKYPGAIDV